MWVEPTGSAERLDVRVREREGQEKLKFGAYHPPKWRRQWVFLEGGGVGWESHGNGVFFNS